MLLVAIVVALKLDKDVAPAEDLNHALHLLTVASETNQSCGVFGDIFSSGGSALLVAMSGAHFDFGEEPAQVLIALARLGQQCVSETFSRHNFGADNSPYPGFLRLLVEAHSARKTVAVEQRHGGQFEFGATCDQRFRQRSAFEKTKCRAGMQLDVSRTSHTSLRETSATKPSTRDRDHPDSTR